MVSLGDTAISLHILQPPLAVGGGGVLESQNPKCQDVPKFQFGGRGRGGLGSQNPKCQHFPKFQFFRGAGGGRGFWKVKTQSAKSCLVKIQSAKICLNFNFRGRGRGVFWNQIPQQGCSGEFGQKFLEACVLEAWLAGASQIVSHILRMWRLISRDTANKQV